MQMTASEAFTAPSCTNPATARWRVDTRERKFVFGLFIAGALGMAATAPASAMRTGYPFAALIKNDAGDYRTKAPVTTGAFAVVVR